MIAPGSGVRVYLACGVTDMRKGIMGLAAHAQLVLKQNPASGAVFCYRGRRGDRIKLLYWDGQGFCIPCASNLCRGDCVDGRRCCERGCACSPCALDREAARWRWNRAGHCRAGARSRRSGGGDWRR